MCSSIYEGNAAVSQVQLVIVKDNCYNAMPATSDALVTMLSTWWLTVICSNRCWDVFLHTLLSVMLFLLFQGIPL